MRVARPDGEQVPARRTCIIAHFVADVKVIRSGLCCAIFGGLGAIGSFGQGFIVLGGEGGLLSGVRLGVDEDDALFVALALRVVEVALAASFNAVASVQVRSCSPACRTAS